MPTAAVSLRGAGPQPFDVERQCPARHARRRVHPQPVRTRLSKVACNSDADHQCHHQAEAGKDKPAKRVAQRLDEAALLFVPVTEGIVPIHAIARCRASRVLSAGLTRIARLPSR